jgi:two-component system nitrogen regulation response regulator NtrX
MQPSILIVDDEPSIIQSLSGLLSDEGYEALSASNGFEALKVIAAESPDLVLLDIWMPGMDGIETLKAIKKEHPYIQVVMVTGHGTIETAVRAIKLGAFDFIEKPLTIDKVVVAINNALNYRRLEEENRYLRKKTIEKNAITGTSPAVMKLRQEIHVAAPSDVWILITGENGVGKELVARTIHHLSNRAAAPLVDVNCAAIADNLIESELFGREKGTDAEAPEKLRGKFELAAHGTLFLDEIGDMSLNNQAKLLRVLEELQFQRVGGSRPLRIGFRLISASNKDLEAEIEAGRFRKELYYRINVVPIHVPSLKERADDIPLLTEHLLQKLSTTTGERSKTVSDEVMALLCSYPWPGNVRELKNLLERLVIMVRKDQIEVDDLPAPYRPESASPRELDESSLLAMASFKKARRAFEREFIHRKLRQFGDDLAATAAAIGIDPEDLRRRKRA